MPLNSPSLKFRNAVRISANHWIRSTKMQRSILFTLTALLLCVRVPPFARLGRSCRTHHPSEQKTYVYEPWIKGKFSEVVTVKNPGKWIFLAGIGPSLGVRRKIFSRATLPAVQVCLLPD